MKTSFESFTKKVISAVGMAGGQKARQAKTRDTVDNLISLGVLLWEVAEADEAFLPKEEEKIEDVLHEYGHIAEQDMPIVLRAIKEASLEKIDLHTFTREVGQDLDFDVRIGILENLFRVACIDEELHNDEYEMIRKIAGLIGVEHQDFINTKIRIKKEFNMDTAGF